MKVLYDHQVFVRQHCGGISHYFSQLMTNLEMPFRLQVLFHPNLYLKDNPLIAAGKYIPLRLSKLFQKQIRDINIPFMRHLLTTSNDLSVFHPTDDNTYWCNWDVHLPVVITVHDLIPELLGHHFLGNADRVIKRRLQLLDKAARIIAISHNTKQDLMTVYKVPSDKIDVIYHGSTPLPYPVKPVCELPDQYLLFVGDRQGYKNFQMILSVLKVLRGEFKQLKLVCTGRAFKALDIKMLRELGLDDSVLSVPCSDAELHYLYNHAVCLVYPSMYEGFGLPVLEAFTHLCPVIASNTSSIPEVAGDGAILLDPNDVKKWSEAIRLLLVDKTLREELLSKGSKQSTLFDWKESALLTERTYRKAIEEYYLRKKL